MVTKKLPSSSKRRMLNSTGFSKTRGPRGGGTKSAVRQVTRATGFGKTAGPKSATVTRARKLSDTPKRRTTTKKRTTTTARKLPSTTKAGAQRATGFTKAPTRTQQARRQVTRATGFSGGPSPRARSVASSRASFNRGGPRAVNRAENWGGPNAAAKARKRLNTSTRKRKTGPRK